MIETPRRLLLACTGTDDPAPAAAAFVRGGQIEVVGLAVDLGAGRPGAVRDRMLDAGAARCHVVDARDRLAREYLWPALRAGVPATAGVPAGPALGAVAFAETTVEVARLEQALVVACAGAGRRAARVEALLRALAPDLATVAPPAGPVAGAGDGPDTLWSRRVSGRLDADTGDGERLLWIRSPARWPGQPAVVEVRLEAGVPVAVNGIDLAPLDLVECLATIAGAHGVGRLEHRTGSRVHVHEAPAAVLLRQARDALARVALPPDLRRFASLAARRYARLIEAGAWHSSLRAALDAFASAAARRLTGTVRLRLHRGRSRVVACVAEEGEPRVGHRTRSAAS